jgi:hypothetical protein
MSISRFFNGQAHSKTADAAPPASQPGQVAPEVAMVNNEIRQQALDNVKYLGLASLGLGAGAGGLVAIKNWLMRPRIKSKALDLGPHEIDLAYPQFEGADVTSDEAKELRRQQQMAVRAKAAAATDLLPSASWFEGKSHQDPMSMPWFLPAATGAVFGGGLGGYALINWLAKQRQKAEQKADVAGARREYEEAMESQYDPKHTHRLLAAKEASSLDALYDGCRAVIKEAGSVNDLLGLGTGAYLTLAGMLAGGAGYGTYKYLQDRSKAKLLEKALKNRAAVRATMNPPEMFIHPVAAKRPLPEEEDAAVSAGG